MTDDEIIDDILRKKGTHMRSRRGPTSQPDRAGSPLPTLREFMGPTTTLDDLKTLTREKAREIMR
jgi:hypothetical protein